MRGSDRRHQQERVTVVPTFPRNALMKIDRAVITATLAAPERQAARPR
jgi:hypothetical protein